MKFATLINSLRRVSNWLFFSWKISQLQVVLLANTLSTLEFNSKLGSVLSNTIIGLLTKFMKYSQSFVIISTICIACAPQAETSSRNCFWLDVIPVISATEEVKIARITIWGQWWGVGGEKVNKPLSQQISSVWWYISIIPAMQEA
jgi:hypothetical protein